MIEFVKIKGSHYQLSHIIAVTRVKAFKDAAGRSIQYVVRLSEEAAGTDEPRLRNRWCTKAEVEPFLRRMRMIEDDSEDPSQEQVAQPVSPGTSTGVE